MSHEKQRKDQFTDPNKKSSRTLNRSLTQVLLWRQSWFQWCIVVSGKPWAISGWGRWGYWAGFPALGPKKAVISLEKCDITKVWFSMIFHDFPWCSMIFYDFLWFSMILWDMICDVWNSNASTIQGHLAPEADGSHPIGSRAPRACFESLGASFHKIMPRRRVKWVKSWWIPSESISYRWIQVLVTVDVVSSCHDSCQFYQFHCNYCQFMLVHRIYCNYCSFTVVHGDFQPATAISAPLLRCQLLAELGFEQLWQVDDVLNGLGYSWTGWGSQNTQNIAM